jgi:hypothetical protein
MTEFANNVAIIKAVVAKELLKKDFTGREGDKGDKGDKGETGEDGESIVGPQGPVGKSGEDGRDGLQGPAGKSGEDGSDGIDGRDGIDGKSIEGPEGPVGKVGQKGQDGRDGRGIKSIKVNNENMLVVTYDDGDMTIAGKVSVTNKTEVIQNGSGLPLGHFAIHSVTLDDDENLIVRCNNNKSFNIPIGTKSVGGYEFTGGFLDRTTGQTGTSDIGSNVSYTSADVAANRWRRFGFSSTRQIANDQPYWADSGDPDEAPAFGTTDYQGVGLFSGAYMPSGVTSMFDFTQEDTYNQEVTTGDNPYTAATGSLNWTQCRVGDFAEVRFDFNITPQFANTTVEVGLIFATRDADDNITFTFPLLTNPIFFGQGSVGKTFLNRPSISAYFASQEDVNARALPAIRADQPVLVQPLTILTTIKR